MSLSGFDELYAAADRRGSPTPVVVAGGADRTVLQAMSQALERGWVTPILCGSEAATRQLAAELEISLDGFRLIDTETPAVAAVAEVSAGDAACLVKGQIATPDLMKAVLARDTGLRTQRVIAQVVLMEIVRDQRRFLLTDTGITIEPTIAQKHELIIHLTDIAHALGGEEIPDDWQPRIAIMSATEKENDSMPDTIEAAEIQRAWQRAKLPRCIVQGPLSFDLAYAADAGEKKNIAGGVVGAADAMLFPNLLSANLTVKAIMYTADCRFGGVLCGTTSPVVFMSRADSTETRLNSLALALRLLATDEEIAIGL
jgi:phosphotransacetylase